MHELAITQNILDVAQTFAKNSGATQVKTVFLRVGVLRDIDPQWLRRYFRYLAKDTMAEGAEVLVSVEPAVCACRACHHRFELDLCAVAQAPVLCLQCTAQDYELISGHEFIIAGIEAR